MRKRTTALDLWPEEPFFPPKEEQTPDGDTSASDTEVEGAEEPNLQINDVPQNKKNLNPTCVTPLIESLARPYFSSLTTVGQRLDRSIDGVVETELVRNSIYKGLLNDLLDTFHSPPPQIRFDEESLKSGRNRKNLWRSYGSVFLNGEEFTVGDIIVIPSGSNGPNPAPSFPRRIGTSSHPSLGKFFWFAQILSMRSDDNTAHVRWFQHGCQTFLQELAHPQELFLTPLCDDIPLISILAKWPCRRLRPGERPSSLKHADLFYSLEYDPSSALFRDITFPDTQSSGSTLCQLCQNREETRDKLSCRPLEDHRLFTGLSFHGEEIHRADSVVFYMSKDVPSGIGQVIDIVENLNARDDNEFELHLLLYERKIDLLRKNSSLVSGLNDERQLFLTAGSARISSSRLMGKCAVIHGKSIGNLGAWLAYSPLHFFVMDHTIDSSGTPRRLEATAFELCGQCMGKEIQDTATFCHWKEKTTPLRVFDPFAGVGAFPLGMAQSGSLELTHAIEINTSAALTLKHNSPSTVVYNQCSNKVLEHAVKRAYDIASTLYSLEGEDEELPPPPNKGDIDCIISGFPCQPHSKLNKFPKVRDLENELFLNTLSWVEFLRPRFCVFENVEGFASFNLKAAQKDKHTVHGGIEKGGIKLLVRTLVTLGYQVRLSLLQAAHYGTPQSRIRFFLWAAQTGQPLPEFPQPTHYFPKARKLAINFQNGDSSDHAFVKWRAPLPFVSIRDAISDLKRWDWAEPRGKRKRNDTQEERERERQGIIQITMHEEDSVCGIAGKDVGYEHPPRSSFAAKCKRVPAEDIQHITAILKDDVIRRVRAIPLDPGADYRSLAKHIQLRDYNFDPRSANARKGYGGGFYGRLDPERYFNTTVTNVHPTAVQSWVLNPWCKRIFSVRESARSQGFPDAFQFIALDGSVNTMHKHIGNAVPWPLGEALGRELVAAQFKDWKAARNSDADAMDID